MARSCAKCGGPMPPPGAGRPRTKCLDCAPRRARPAPALPVFAAPPGAPAPEPAGTLREAVLRELAAAGRLGSSAGLAAVALAERIEDGRDAGAALAALVKQLSATMDEALRGAAVAEDPLDELRARREARGGA